MVHFLKFLFSKVFIINLLVAIVLLGGGLYLTLDYLDDYTLHGQTLEVPNLEGKDFELLANDLNPKEFTAVIADSIYLRGMKSGSIVDQDPRPGKTVKEGRKIYLTVASKQPPKITMPQLVDLSLRQATSLMETYGIEVGELIYRPDFCENCILEQQIDGEPIEAGTKIDGSSVIDLVIGQGLSSELTPVPYLLGLTFEEAKLLMNQQFLNSGGAEYDETCETEEDSAKAVIYQQLPPPSEEEPAVQMGSSIYLYLTSDTNKVIHTLTPPDIL